ncbi:hypothetical protein F5Y17DRAFT_410864 [Xylariaceae sp. FL0594]|nr:hypothetical protein F5Y17DRAFT_410864 [Xylariaceae sp. FL0594]
MGKRFLSFFLSFLTTCLLSFCLPKLEIRLNWCLVFKTQQDEACKGISLCYKLISLVLSLSLVSYSSVFLPLSLLFSLSLPRNRKI